MVRAIAAKIPRSQPEGSYRLVAVADFDDRVTESDETNNVDATTNPVVDVQGIAVVDALDNPQVDLNDGFGVQVIGFENSGDGEWFGQEGIFVEFAVDTIGVMVGNNDAAESPPLLEGQTTVIGASIPGPSKIGFYWSSATESTENFLQFTIDGTEPAENGRISGVDQFSRVEFILPSLNNEVAWTYTQGRAPIEGVEESVFVDAVTIEPVEGIDLIVDNVEFTSGTFVPQQDLIEIVILARNQGIPVDIPEDFMVRVVLSLDQDPLSTDDDILLGNLDRFSDNFEANDRFGYAPNFDIPSMVDLGGVLQIIPPGDYFLVVTIDSTGAVTESVEDNNTFVSASAGIRIEPQPNLVPVALNFNTVFPDQETDPEPDLILFGDEIILEFSVRNDGLAITTTPFKIQLVLSSNVIFGEEGDFVFFSVTETTGLPVGQTRNYQFSRQVPPDTPIGEFFFMGLVIDAEGDITESNEEDNALGSDNRNLVFSEVTVAEAVRNPQDGFLPNIRNSDLPGVDAPFFGQSEERFEGPTAAEGVNILDDEVAGFEFDIDNPDGPSVISFAWKVSSERAFVAQGEQEEILKFDTLSFFIDGDLQKFISGFIDWQIESFEVPQGIHTVRWEYEKDGTVSSGQDTGWVDRIQITSPDLTFESGSDPIADPGIMLLNTPPVDGFTSGAELQVQLRFTNQDVAEVRSTPPFTIQIRISPDPQWDEDDSQVKNDFVLENFLFGDGVDPGETVTVVRTVDVPLNIAQADNFRLAARLDFFNDVPESRELNNTVFSSAAVVPIQPNINLDQALDFVAPFGWKTGGDSTWFGQNSVFAPPEQTLPGNDSAAQSSPVGVGEETFLETQLTELTVPALPALVSFSWKVSSLPNFNRLRFLISDVEQARISGEVDWQQETYFVPAGTQKVQWLYTKDSGEEIEGVLDTGWVDNVTFTPINLPDLRIKILEVNDNNPGVYILDRLDDPDGDKVPIRVVAENRGTDVPPTFNFVASDIELRLTADLVWGNDDDIPLGQVAFIQQSQGGSGLQIVFEGDVLIPDYAAAGDYYVAAFLDFNERVVEYEPADFIPFTATDNNFAITGTRQVTIRRLPDLVIENFQIDNSKLYYPEGALPISFDIRNRGLEPTVGSVLFNQRITLFSHFPFALVVEDLLGQTVNDVFLVDRLLLATLDIDVLSNFPENAFLPGIDEFNPNDGVIHIESELILPTLAEIQDVLPGALPDVTLRIYLLLIEIDSANEIEESDERNRFVPVFPIQIVFSPSGPEDFAAWAARNELDPIDPDVDPDGDGLNNLQEFAVNSNPLFANTSGLGMLESAGIVVSESEDYLGLTFDLNIFANDLLYFVEVSQDGMSFTPILTIEPPFLDFTGPNSLNGNAGLNTSNLVISIAERGYTARITVRDSVPVEAVQQRFMRLRIQND